MKILQDTTLSLDDYIANTEKILFGEDIKGTWHEYLSSS